MLANNLIKKYISIYKNYGKIEPITTIFIKRRLEILEETIKNGGDGKTLLDIGSNIGIFSLLFAKKGYAITALEPEKNLIQVADKLFKINGHKAEFISKKIEDLKEKEKYDIILCLEVLEHLNNQDLALQKIYTLLKKEGLVIISMPNLFSYYYLRKRFFAEILGQMKKEGSEHYKWPFTKIKNLIKKNNFKILSVRGIMILPIEPKIQVFLQRKLSPLYNLLERLDLILSSFPILNNFGANIILFIQK